MALTVMLVLALVGLCFVVADRVGYAVLWCAVLVLYVMELLRLLPVGK